MGSFGLAKRFIKKPGAKSSLGDPTKRGGITGPGLGLAGVNSKAPCGKEYPARTGV